MKRIVFFYFLFWMQLSVANNILAHLKLGNADLALDAQVKKGIYDQEDSLLLGMALLYTYRFLDAEPYLLSTRTNIFQSNKLKNHNYYTIPFCTDLNYNKAILLLELERNNEAIIHFEKFKNDLKNEDDIRIIDEYIMHCSVGEMTLHVTNGSFITPLGKDINSYYNEHSPVFSKDGTQLLYASDRLINSNIKHDEIIKTSNQNNFTPLFSYLKNTGRTPLCLSEDEKTLFIFEKFNKDDGHIFWTTKTETGWSTPQMLPSPINSEYKETSAYYVQKTNTLFFSSNRPGGYGGQDIYISNWYSDGWTKPVNLGLRVNGMHDDEAPFYDEITQLFYYSSNGEHSIGGYDIFSINLYDSLSIAHNLGTPINSPNDDIFFTRKDPQNFVFASNRKESTGEMDLFNISLPDISDSLYKWHTSKAPDRLSPSVHIKQCFSFNLDHTPHALEKKVNFFWLIDQRDTVWNKSTKACISDYNEHVAELFVYDTSLNFYCKEQILTYKKDSIQFSLSNEDTNWCILPNRPIDYELVNTYWYTNNGLFTNEELPTVNQAGIENKVHHMLSEIKVKDALYYVKIDAL